MNPDTEKADELLRREIESQQSKIDGWSGFVTMGIFLEDGKKYLALLETIQKDREALKRAVISFEKIRWGYDGPCGSNAIIDRLDEALASQTETIIKTLS